MSICNHACLISSETNTCLPVTYACGLFEMLVHACAKHSCSCHVTMRGIPRVCEVIIELYCTKWNVFDISFLQVLKSTVIRMYSIANCRNAIVHTSSLSCFMHKISAHRCYIMIISCALTVCLIYTPSAQRPQASLQACSPQASGAYIQQTTCVHGGTW